MGCIRRLEINNKIYNFEPAERQGDVLFGIDIGELAELRFAGFMKSISVTIGYCHIVRELPCHTNYLLILPIGTVKMLESLDKLLNLSVTLSAHHCTYSKVLNFPMYFDSDVMMARYPGYTVPLTLQTSAPRTPAALSLAKTAGPARRPSTTPPTPLSRGRPPTEKVEGCASALWGSWGNTARNPSRSR